MSEWALQVDNLVKIYQPRRQPPVHAVDGMSFAVRPGQIFGLLGPNGAGKTTLLKVLTTLLRPTAGNAQVFGHDVVSEPLEVRRRLVVVLQESAVEMFLSVRDNLLTFGRFQGLAPPEAKRRADQVLERFHLTAAAEQKAQDLSGGLRRRVQLAKTFMVESPIMFLDEFSAGMDPLLKRAVLDYLRDEARRGRTIVLTTQVLSEAEELCDDILIMNKGKQVVRGDLYQLKLLSQDLYEVALTFEELPPSIEHELERIRPVRVSIEQNTIELALKGDEAQVLEWVSELAKQGRLLKVEVSGASLEDIFVQLMRGQT